MEHIGSDGHKRRFDITELALHPTPISINCYACAEIYRSSNPLLIRHWMSAHKCSRTHSADKHANLGYAELITRFRAAPCPICKDGESRLFMQEGVQVQYDEGDRKACDDDFTNYVECVCGFRGPSATHAEAAVEAWNNNLTLLARRAEQTQEAA